MQHLRKIPSTIASRENLKAVARSLAGLRNSGDAGKASPVGENGGNVSSSNASYSANVAGMTLESAEEEVEETLEEYQARIMESFGITEGKSDRPLGVMHSFIVVLSKSVVLRRMKVVSTSVSRTLRSRTRKKQTWKHTVRSSAMSVVFPKRLRLKRP